MWPMLRLASSPVLLGLLLLVAEPSVPLKPAFAAPALSASLLPQAGCGAAKDLTVQALERMQANSDSSQLQDANELLKRASDLCSKLGEAW
jgi:hypothetical protein